MRLPETWIEARMTDVCELNPRLSAEDRRDEHIAVSFVPMSAVDEVTGVISKPEVRTFGEVAKGYTNFRERDVLFAKVTPCMENGKAAIAGELKNGQGFGSTEFHVLRPTEAVLPEYIFSFVRQRAFRDRAASAFVGTGGLQRVPPEFLSRVKVPLPTLPEQQRIVDVLRQAEVVSKLRNDFNELLARAKRQLFVEMFGDPNPKINTRWPVAKLGSFVTVATGGTPSREQTDSYGDVHAWVKSTDLKDDVIRITEEQVSELGIQRSNAKLYPKQTVMLAMYGQGQTRGRTGKLLIDAACNQACAALLPSDELLPDYLWVWLQLSYEAVRALGRGGQQENLNLDIVRGIKLPKPPVPLQQEFARRLNGLMELTKLSRTAGERFDGLREVLQIDALTGNATAAWRQKHADEIAAAALTRDALLSERNAAFVSTNTENRIHFTEHTSAERRTGFSRPRRQALIDQLSSFQHEVWNMLRYEWRGAVLADDPAVFGDFCTNPQTAWRLEGFDAAPIKVRRALEQLATMGLVRKFSLPQDDPSNETTLYLTAFRPLREDKTGSRAEEDVALADVASVQAELKRREKGGV